VTADDTAASPTTISSEELTPDVVSPVSKRNWFVRHWRGEESLGIAYWRNSVLFANITPWVLLTLYPLLDPFAHSLRWDSTVSLLLMPLALVIWVWGIVGVIRSANRHTKRGGSRLWANVARVMVCFGIIGTAVRLYTSVPSLELLAKLAADHDPIPKVWIYVVDDGKTLWLQGILGEGSAEEVQRAFGANPLVKTVMLSSRGGRAAEAKRIAQIISQKHLDTAVRGSCQSACTYLLLAGEHRAAEASSKIGFHRATFPGITSLGETYSNYRMLAHYRSVGLPSWFIDRAVGTPPTSMWYPTHQELLEARVLSPDGTW
jgi:hypothetical protein